MHIQALLCLSLGTACAARSARTRAVESPIATTVRDSAWLAREPVICGEVRGRVLDQAGQRPMAETFVSLDSSSRGVLTDSLGYFRVALPRDTGALALTRPTFLRIRRVGARELRVLLPPALGYAVEVQLWSGGFHVDHMATLRIKSPGFCARAS